MRLIVQLELKNLTSLAGSSAPFPFPLAQDEKEGCVAFPIISGGLGGGGTMGSLLVRGSKCAGDLLDRLPDFAAVGGPDVVGKIPTGGFFATGDLTAPHLLHLFPSLSGGLSAHLHPTTSLKRPQEEHCPFWFNGHNVLHLHRL